MTPIPQTKTGSDVSQKGYIPWQCSSVMQIKAMKGLYRYAEEMAEVQGVEEIDRILEIPDVIRRMGHTWVSK